MIQSNLIFIWEPYKMYKNLTILNIQTCKVAFFLAYGTMTSSYILWQWLWKSEDINDNILECNIDLSLYLPTYSLPLA